MASAGAEDIAKLDEISDLAEFHLEKKKYDKVLELDNEFHELLYHMADSKMLYRTLSGFHHYLEIIRKQECFSLKTLAITGKDLIRLGMKPGKEIGEILNLALDLVIENPSLNNKAYLMNFAAAEDAKRRRAQ